MPHEFFTTEDSKWILLMKYICCNKEKTISYRFHYQFLNFFLLITVTWVAL